MFLRQACILQMLCAIEALVSASTNQTSGPDPSLWPVINLHIPKTAGNFATAVIRTGCSGDGNISKWWSTRGAGEAFPAGCTRRNFARMSLGHTPLELPTEQDIKHVVTLFRDPYQRLMSGYFHGRHDCPDELRRVAPSCPSVDGVYDLPACKATLEVTLPRVERYAECAGNCQTNMVFGDLCNGTSRKVRELSKADVATVHDRINHMGFVGLTEEYDLSVCLFHARFGGSCEEVEFANQRPGARHYLSSNHGYDVPKSERLQDLLQDELATYEVARARFWTDVMTFGVSRSFCKRLCPDAPRVFDIPPSLLQSAQPGASDLEYDWPGRLSFDVDSFY